MACAGRLVRHERRRELAAEPDDPLGDGGVVTRLLIARSLGHESDRQLGDVADDSLGDASIAPIAGAGRLLRHERTRRGSAARTIAMAENRA